MAYERWQTARGRGKRPATDEDPTEDQLAVPRHLLDSGEVPYVGVSVGGQHGNGLARKQKLIGMVMNAKGEIVPTDMVGPAAFALWSASWTVFSNAMILLGAVDVGTLDEYYKCLKRFHDRYCEKSYALLYSGGRPNKIGADGSH